MCYRKETQKENMPVEDLDVDIKREQGYLYNRPYDEDPTLPR
jgi:hypothetical protein